MKTERLLEKFSLEDRENILKEIEEVKNMLREEILDIQIVAIIIHFYFKNKDKI
jgi:hypothetical protein